MIIRSTGSMIGWGYQLQSPVVVGILTLIMLGIGMILLTNINVAAGFTNIGSSVQNRNDYSGSFFTGVLAVVVASHLYSSVYGSCCGLRSPPAILCNFAYLFVFGLGFAGPYLILAIKPNGLALCLKPGAWMETLNNFLHFQ